MSAVFWISLAGAGGALTRFTVTTLINRRIRPTHFPVATFTINLLGSGCLGLVTGLLAPSWLLFQLAGGFLGGFSTFSTFTNDFVKLSQAHPWTAVTYLTTSVSLSIGSAFLGYVLIR
ncbi:fluoride efflux transporter FluC [Levilactobacillus acidifarinae]|uniref:Fluoride-specific ion channel FluC n=1 Tax=Levilactobacillus acidifarinae DSM 19394 = JCM 15949 TaxID=1423715 RepID=A0A0R1LHL3_9LACO|nr:CrcB family protein [Levilactobacillus acidifarinae]KRK95372.1 hypothetical protein FD25_GL001490 [Levilactobacillus acidifarinae DSM 19394]GEO70036.1 putative fluoride ion transporter CrcB 2 [Levilactobacillus acidifarinae]